MQETPIGYSTPADPGQLGFNKFNGGGPVGLGGGLKGKGKETWLIGAGGGGGVPLRRTASGRYGDVTETSIDDQ
jgi:hypothetical protein